MLLLFQLSTPLCWEGAGSREVHHCLTSHNRASLGSHPLRRGCLAHKCTSAHIRCRYHVAGVGCKRKKRTLQNFKCRHPLTGLRVLTDFSANLSITGSCYLNPPNLRAKGISIYFLNGCCAVRATGHN